MKSQLRNTTHLVKVMIKLGPRNSAETIMIEEIMADQVGYFEAIRLLHGQLWKTLTRTGQWIIRVSKGF